MRISPIGHDSIRPESLDSLERRCILAQVVTLVEWIRTRVGVAGIDVHQRTAPEGAGVDLFLVGVGVDCVAGGVLANRKIDGNLARCA